MFVMLATPYFIKYASHAMTDVPTMFFFVCAMAVLCTSIHSSSCSRSAHAAIAQTKKNMVGTSVMAWLAYLMKYGVASITNIAIAAPSLSSSSWRASQKTSTTVPTAHNAAGAFAIKSEMPNPRNSAACIHTNSGGCSSAVAPRIGGFNHAPWFATFFASAEYSASS